jgi:hypothetical protein
MPASLQGDHAVPTETFHEGSAWSVPIRDLGLTIAHTDLEPILAEFERELQNVGIKRLRPRFYLSTEWGVPFGTVAIAIPFYLARSDLTALQEERAGHVEGVGRTDILRYLRHEMGHVVNYAYRLYDDEDWVKQFGSITQPYEEEYRPKPFSRRFVNHLPGWYAQKHPDEDWAETFAVWMTPRRDWQAEYAERPTALAKLDYCDRTMARLRDRDPVVTATELDEDVGALGYSVEDYYRRHAPANGPFPPGLDGALRAIFEDQPAAEAGRAAHRPASALIRRLERTLTANVYRWTGHFPERTRPLVRQLADRADQLRLVYPEQDEVPSVVALTTLITALAMNHVHHGTYLP